MMICLNVESGYPRRKCSVQRKPVERLRMMNTDMTVMNKAVTITDLTQIEYSAFFLGHIVCSPSLAPYSVIESTISLQSLKLET